MTWWYENEEEEMKLYKNEDLCIECKNEFFSKPYDHRDPTPGQLGYCIKCDNCLIKEKKMEFLRERVYTALNADELRAGDKVIVADCIADLKQFIIDQDVDELYEVDDESCEYRFIVEDGVGIVRYALAYLVERKENCTNCGSHEVCGYVQNVSKFACLNRCENYKPKTEQKAEKHTDYNHCEEATKAYACAMTNACPNKRYRPFKGVDELIEKWWKLNGWSKAEAKYKKDKLRMPLIWLKNKYNLCHISSLVTGFFDSKVIISGEKIESMEMLYADWVFPDGSPCGVEE